MLTTQDRIRLFGTAEAPATGRLMEAGPLALELFNGGLRNIRWWGTELIGAVGYPVRDQDWGTCSLTTVGEVTEDLSEGWRYRRAIRTSDGSLTGEFEVSANSSGSLDLNVSFLAIRDFKTNRAGFIVLHPISKLSGASVDVVHGDGSRETLTFSDKISPGQPIFDIVRMTYGIEGMVADISFSGEIFEMEDQRNWSDASYKTYCRPLSEPTPYVIRRGQTVSQQISLRFSGDSGELDVPRNDRFSILGADASLAPEISIAIEEGWLPVGREVETVRTVAPARVIGRMTASDLDTLRSFTELVRDIGCVSDLEILVSDEQAHISENLELFGQACRRLHFDPEHIVALPRAYLKSYQPNGAWPNGVSPNDAARLAQRAFPRASIGCGSLTNFTELNRCPPDPAACDFITHGSTAIVHAADDLSVFETLESLPMIFRSARAYAPEKAYRLGLVSIGMRSNPYGASAAENEDQVRREMAMFDPRQRGLFAAAWMVGVVAATQDRGVQSLALAAPFGPFGLVYRKESWAQPLYDDEGGRVVFPAFHVVRALAALGGKPRRKIEAPIGCHAVAVEVEGTLEVVLVNGTPNSRSVALPSIGESRILDLVSFDAATRDPHWLDNCDVHQIDQIELGPYAVAIVSLPSGTADRRVG